MAKNDLHVFADSAKAPDRKVFMPPLVCWPVAPTPARRSLTATG
jgi:hypothetical protein